MSEVKCIFFWRYATYKTFEWPFVELMLCYIRRRISCHICTFYERWKWWHPRLAVAGKYHNRNGPPESRHSQVYPLFSQTNHIWIMIKRIFQRKYFGEYWFHPKIRCFQEAKQWPKYDWFWIPGALQSFKTIFIFHVSDIRESKFSLHWGISRSRDEHLSS